MYGVILKYMGENRNNEILQEIKFFSNLNEALESFKNLLCGIFSWLWGFVGEYQRRGT
ncbi:hypothetical protein ACYJA9_001598 [Campylobacter upsaliensis]|nr:hypothetical protein [Campylobacter upsaliensis]EIP2875070.1 hypothetical protein [Campylobacter upsaliensis]EIR8270168.1 hypothetical protein [Campylobacter upsaliensis]EKB9601218.1 hypothetical protein [Campylobacter upsaliensis]EKG8179388.1 hypothetical protein [Campylobacter upsaliensis]